MTSLVTDYLLIDRVRWGGGDIWFGVHASWLRAKHTPFSGPIAWTTWPSYGSFFFFVHEVLWVREREFAHRLVFQFFYLLTCYTHQVLVISKYEKGFNFDQQIQAGIRNVRKCFYLQRILFSRFLLNDLKAIYNKKAPSQVMT